MRVTCINRSNIKCGKTNYYLWFWSRAEALSWFMSAMYVSRVDLIVSIVALTSVTPTLVSLIFCVSSFTLSSYKAIQNIRGYMPGKMTIRKKPKSKWSLFVILSEIFAMVIVSQRSDNFALPKTINKHIFHQISYSVHRRVIPRTKMHLRMSMTNHKINCNEQCWHLRESAW